MTLLEIRTLVLSWLDDVNAGYFTVPQVNVFINNAQRECQKRLIKAFQNHYIVCVQTTLVANQNEYILPDNFKDMNRLEIIVSGSPPTETRYPMQTITMNQQDLVANSTTGSPQYYFFKRNRLVVFPVPDQPYVMRMNFTYLVPDMAVDTDVPDLPEEYHELIALLAAEDGFLKDGRANELIEKKIAAYQQMFDEDARKRQQQSPRSVVETGYSMDQGYYW